MESGRNQTKIALPSSAALSSCFTVTVDGGANPDAKSQNCPRASTTAALGAGACVIPPVLAGGDRGSLGCRCLVKAHKGAGDPQHPTIFLPLMKIARGLHWVRALLPEGDGL